MQKSKPWLIRHDFDFKLRMNLVGSIKKTVGMYSRRSRSILFLIKFVGAGETKIRLTYDNKRRVDEYCFGADKVVYVWTFPIFHSKTSSCNLKIGGGQSS